MSKFGSPTKDEHPENLESRAEASAPDVMCSLWGKRSSLSQHFNPRGVEGGMNAAPSEILANARPVIGVISGAGGFSPGMAIGSRADESRDLPVSMSGVVYVRVSAEAGAVEPGDLLVPSSIAGVGMRAENSATAYGTVFGKALESWSGVGEGLGLMLVMNR